MTSAQMRYQGCLMGLAVGDALGTTVEFEAPGTFSLLTDIVGGGPFDVDKGQWTDDTSMALCLAESLVTCATFNARDQMERYTRWWKEGCLSSIRCRDKCRTGNNLMITKDISCIRQEISLYVMWTGRKNFAFYADQSNLLLARRVESQSPHRASGMTLPLIGRNREVHMIPTSIELKHIRAAIDSVRKNGVPRSRQSREFDLVVDGKRYPPKYIIALAAEYATGSALPSAEFGGGTETNNFFKRLGFSVVAKSVANHQQKFVSEPPALAAELKPSYRSGGILRVARAWMNMGVTMTQFRENPDRWTEHKRLVIEQFNIDPRAYVDRVNNLLAQAECARADAVLLPACALVHNAAMPRSAYKLPKIGVVVAGVLEVINPAREYAIASREGEILAEFDSTRVILFDGGKFTTFAAISSTIKRLSDEPDEEPTSIEPLPDGNDIPIVLLDAGHHPYSDYYRRHSMRIAAEVIFKRYGRKAAVVLSSWQYVNSTPGPSWCMPDGISTFERMEIDGPDLLDVVEISFSRH